MGKKKGKSKAQDEAGTDGAGDAVPSPVVEEEMREGGGEAVAQKLGGGGRKKGKKDRKKKAPEDDWDDDLAEIVAEAGLSAETGDGEGEEPVVTNSPSGGEGDVPPGGHSGAGGKKKKLSAMDYGLVGEEENQGEQQETEELEEEAVADQKPQMEQPVVSGSGGGGGGAGKGGGGGKKKRKKKDQMDWEDDIEMLAREIEGGAGGGTDSGQSEKPTSDSPILERHGDQPDDNGTETVTGEGATSSAAGEPETDTKTVKTKAGKKAAKKERDKKKKEAAKRNANPAGPSTEQTPQTAAVEDETEAGKEEKNDGTKNLEQSEKKDPELSEQVGDLAAAEGVGEEEDDEEGDEKKKKKKKKKKAGGEEDKKSKTKKPGKSAILKMKEQIELIRAEQKRREEEERARALAEEEARRKAEEEAQLEQERKEKRKQKEKERRERRKKEGKPVTKAEREKQAKSLAMLQAMREQGLQIPAITAEKGEGGGGKVRYGSRQRTKKQHVAGEGSANTEEMGAEESVEVTGVEEEEGETERQDSEVKRSWEDESENEEEQSVKDNWDDEEEGRAAEPEGPSLGSEVKETQSPEQGEWEEEGEEEEDGSSEEESSESDSDEELTPYEKAEQRIMVRRQRNKEGMSLDYLRSPVVCVLGHVDTGKTKILDKIRHTNVQDGEAGGITQQIGATFVPEDAIRAQTKMVKEFVKTEIKLPGLLIIDTPGHESFSNLRSRGSSMCDLAILVVDIMHGLEPQTLESLGLLRKGNTPFVVALNKIDRLFDWRRMPTSSVKEAVKKQNRNTKDEFDERVKGVVTEFAEQGLNVALFWEKVDFTDYVPLVPTSAHSGDGMGDLISLLVTYSQGVLAPKLMLGEELEAVVLEVKVIAGLGTTVDVILRNGILKEGDTLVLTGTEGPFSTQVRALLMPQPLRELRVKNAYVNHKVIIASQGIKITAKDLEKTLAGTPIFAAKKPDEIEVLKDEASKVVSSMLSAIQLQERGVYVQASTLGSLEALLAFLKQSKIPYCGVNIGPVHKRDVMKTSVMLERDNQWAVILAFDVKVEREAQEMADNVGVKIFTADIIYHLFDNFLQHRKELRDRQRRQHEAMAIFPCKLRILPNCVFNTRDPIVAGVVVEAGLVKKGTVLTVPSKSFVDVGVVSSLEVNHKQVDVARKGEEVCIKIEPTGGEAPKLYGRHFDDTDLLVSKVSRESIDAVKKYFREDLQKGDWQLFIELKKIFQII